MYMKLTCKLVQLNKWAIFTSFWNLILYRALRERGAYLRFWLRREGLIGKGDFAERGAKESFYSMLSDSRFKRSVDYTLYLPR